MRNPRLDRIDIAIMAELQVNGRIKNVDLAERVNLSASPCLQRVRRLEQAGYIKSYGADIDISLITDTVEIFTEFTIAEHTQSAHQYFEEEVEKIPQVISCFKVSGGYDYLTHFVCTSIQQYQRVIQSILDSEMQVTRYFSYVVMEPIVRRPWPLQILAEDD